MAPATKKSESGYSGRAPIQGRKGLRLANPSHEGSVTVTGIFAAVELAAAVIAASLRASLSMKKKEQ